MSWLVLIFLSVNLFAVASLFDKFFCEKKFKNVVAYGSIVYFLSAIFIISLPFFLKLSFPLGKSLFFAIASAPVFFVMWLLWWWVLKKGEVSRASAISNTGPLFIALLAAVFLNESIGGIKWLAIILIVIGAILCCWENKTDNHFNRVYLVVILAALINAVGNIFSKIALGGLSPFAVYAVCYYATLPFYLPFLFNKKICEEMKENLKEKKTAILLLIRVTLGFAAISLSYAAMAAGPVSLVMAVNGIGPLLVFIYSTIISLFWPKLIKEEINRQVLFTKAMAIILIVGGVILINS